MSKSQKAEEGTRLTNQNKAPELFEQMELEDLNNRKVFTGLLKESG
jgi:hypothetical protein